jgi:hypothetical protein
MRSFRLAKACVLGAMLVAGVAEPARAQDPARVEDPPQAKEKLDAESRRLHEHVFLVPMLQNSAFVTTHVGIREGFALLDIPDFPVATLGTRDLQLSGVQQSLDLGVALTDWIGLFAAGRAVVVAGVDRPSLIADGATLEFGAGGGAIARVFKSDSTGTQVSLRAQFAYADRHEITLQPFVQAVVTATSATLAQIVENSLGNLILVPVSETSVQGGVLAAQYFNRYLSAQASVMFDRGWETREPFLLDLGERTAEEGDNFRIRFGLAAELDFTRLFAPVSLMAEYLFIHGERSDTHGRDVDLGSNNLGFGIYYVGRPNLQLGLGTITTLSAEPRVGLDENGARALSGEPTLSSIELVLRYFW